MTTHERLFRLRRFLVLDSLERLAQQRVQRLRVGAFDGQVLRLGERRGEVVTVVGEHRVRCGEAAQHLTLDGGPVDAFGLQPGDTERVVGQVETYVDVERVELRRHDPPDLFSVDVGTVEAEAAPERDDHDRLLVRLLDRRDLILEGLQQRRGIEVLVQLHAGEDERTPGGDVDQRGFAVPDVVESPALVDFGQRAGVRASGVVDPAVQVESTVIMPERQVVDDVFQLQEILVGRLADDVALHLPFDAGVHHEDRVIGRIGGVDLPDLVGDAGNDRARRRAGVAHAENAGPADVDEVAHQAFRARLDHFDQALPLQRLQPGHLVADERPVVVTCDGQAGDAGFFQLREDVMRLGIRRRIDVPRIEEVAGDEDEVDLFGDGIFHDLQEGVPEIEEPLVEVVLPVAEM